MASLFFLFSQIAHAESSGSDAAVSAVGIGLTLLVFLFTFVVIALSSIISIGGTILWIIMLIDCAKREFKNSNDKVLWILVIILAGAIGAVVYYFAVKKKNKKMPSVKHKTRKPKKKK